MASMSKRAVNKRYLIFVSISIFTIVVFFKESEELKSRDILEPQTFKTLKNSETDQSIPNRNGTSLRILKDNEAYQKERIPQENPNQLFLPHPHTGAQFPNGSFGYVAPLSSVRDRIIEQMKQMEGANEMNFLPMSEEEYEYACDKPPTQGIEKRMGWDLLTTAIEIDTLDALQEHIQDESPSKIKTPKPKLLCAIYTHEGNHHRLEAAVESWAWRCDGFFAASTVTNKTIGAVNLTHMGPESYNNMWQKTRSIWCYIFDNYLNDFDFFWLGGDDVFMIVENMYSYLWSLSDSIGAQRLHQQPLYLGHRIPQLDPKYTFAGGGPGYMFNRLTLIRFVNEAIPTCNPNTQAPEEDRMVGICLREIGIELNDTVDEAGKQMFHGMDPNFIATYDGKSGYFKSVYELWGERYGFKSGKNLVSRNSITFHILRHPFHMKRVHAITYKTCPKGSAVDNGLISNRRKFLSYTSSKWEQLWLDNVLQWERENSICHEMLINQKDYTHDMLALICTSRFPPPYDSWCIIDDAMRPLYYNLKSDRSIPIDESMISHIRPKTIPKDIHASPSTAVKPTSKHDHIVSKYLFFDEVSGEEFEEYIDPLVSDLGFPLATCLDSRESCKMHDEDCAVFSRGWIFPIPPLRKVSQKAFYYGNETSLPYFENIWERQNISFDKIFSFEEIKFKDENETLGYSVQAALVDFVGKLQFYLGSILSSTQEQDYVLLELDMNEAVYKDIMEQVRLGDASTIQTIDEIFIKINRDMKNILMLDVIYSMLLHLRRKGIRAHSWM